MKVLRIKFIQVLSLCSILLLGTAHLIAQDSWTSRTAFPGPIRFGAFSFVVNGQMYIGGGSDVSSNLNDLWAYNPSTDTWMQKNNYPANLGAYVTSFVVNGTAFIATGDDLTNTGTYSAEVWAYNAATDTWIQKNDFPGGVRANATAFAIGDKGYLGLGDNNTGPSFNDFWEYDPTTDTWTQKADFVNGRIWATGFSIDNIGYVGTGGAIISGTGVDQNDFWAYDPATDTWTQKADFPGTGRERAISFNLCGQGYIAGGLSRVSGTGVYEEDVWSYIPALDTWQQQPNLLGGGRVAGVAAVIDNNAFVTAGFTSGVNTNDLLALSTPIVNPLWATFFGNASAETVMDIKTASNGDVFITGATLGTNFPFSTTIPPLTYGTLGDVNTFVARVKADGTTVVWAAIISGPGFDIACRLTVDTDDNVYIAGATKSNFGITSPAPVAPYAGGEDAFCVKFDGADGNLLWHTYIGTSTDESGEGIEVSLAHNEVFVSGTTVSATLPAQNTTFGHVGAKDTYCAKLDPYTGQLAWTAQVGTGGNDEGWGAAIDSDGNAYITGRMAGGITSALPISNTYGTGGGGDSFAVKFDKDNGNILWGSRFGDAVTEIGFEVEVNSRDEVIIGGHAGGLYNPSAVSNALVVSFNHTDGSLLYDYQYGGTVGDMAYDVMVDEKDNIYLSGFTFSTDLVTANTAARNPAYKSNYTGSSDAFMAKLNDNGGAAPLLDWQTYYSTADATSSSENASAITVDSQGFVYVAGHTSSSNFEVMNSAIQPTYEAGRDGFIIKLEVKPEVYTIAGTIRTEDGLNIPGTTVDLVTPATPQSQITDATGTYRFESLPEGNYTLTPSKAGNAKNGVNIFDLFILRNHLLGNVPLNSPYKLIAADIDNSGTVDAADEMALQAAAINPQPTFPIVWRFVPADYVFPDPANPFAPPFPEFNQYSPLNRSYLTDDFLGIKIGDLNNSRSL